MSAPISSEALGDMLRAKRALFIAAVEYADALRAAFTPGSESVRILELADAEARLYQAAKNCREVKP